ncbi:hypothetical protein [Clostridium pasteurianum]|nr:hypothetical protein [Clostridium pasteurianum]
MIKYITKCFFYEKHHKYEGNVEMDSTQSDNENLLVIGATNTPWQVD